MTVRDEAPVRAAGDLPIIAIVGRPNAGKSTLFNRLTRSQKAQVDAEPGVTRDRNFAQARHEDRDYIVVDTGGLDTDAQAGIAAAIRSQSESAIEEADAVILLLDGRAGVSPGDREVLARLRRSRKPFWVAVNKLDVPGLDDDAVDFFRLGIDNVMPISAAHGRGIPELMETVLAGIEAAPRKPATAAPKPLAVAIVGRPNVGKSSLLNRLVGYDRSIVTPVAGTTRDAIDTPISRGKRDYVLVDTAGIRRRPRVSQQLERGSVTRALRAMERADVALLVVDGTEGMTDQDARLAGHAWEKGRGLILVVNKCDLLEDRKRFHKQLEGDIRRQYPFVDAVPVLFISAKTGDGISAVLPTVDQVGSNQRRDLPTVALNQLLHRATAVTAPPSTKGLRPNFKYAVQTGICPPRITVFCSHPDLVVDSYTRFLVNRLREEFPLTGTPVRLEYRRGSQSEPEKPPSPSGRRAAAAKRTTATRRKSTRRKS